MPTIPKPDPRKYCRNCRTLMRRKRFNGRLEDLGVFKRRQYCDDRCYREAQLSTVPLSKSGHLWRARKYLGPACEDCGATEGRHVHHIDRDWTNNDPTNLRTLCSSCHLKHHWGEEGGHRDAITSRRRVPLEAIQELEGFAETVRPLLADGQRAWLDRIVDLMRDVQA